MAEREQDAPRTEPVVADPVVHRSDSGPRPGPAAAVTPTEQALINEAQALASGEENVV